MAEMKIEMCALCGKPAEIVTLRLKDGGEAVPLTQCECRTPMPRVQTFDESGNYVPPIVSGWGTWLDDKTPLQQTRCRQFAVGTEDIGARPPVRFSDLNEGDRLRLRDECTKSLVEEIGAHYDKWYGDTIERMALEIESLKQQLANKTRLRNLQSNARRKEREQVVLDTSMWDD